MKKTRLFSLFLIPLFAWFLVNGCASQRAQKAATVSFDHITFGKSGGFTNMTDSYCLSNLGIVSRMMEGDQQEIGKISKSRVKEIDDSFRKAGFGSIGIQETGNMTYFIEVTSAEGTHKVTWTESTEAAELKALYKILVGTL